MATLECWFDLDGVIRILPFRLKEVELNRKMKNFLAFTEVLFLRRTYNFLIRKPNAEILAFMEELNKKKSECRLFRLRRSIIERN